MTTAITPPATSPRCKANGTMPSRKLDRSAAVSACVCPSAFADGATAGAGTVAGLAGAGFGDGGTCAIANPATKVAARDARNFTQRFMRR
ncbi:MAG: hypothetical protein J0I96_09830 [Rhodanobacter sp.]|nr:hypothetical protein [Rhodanobacter sp.]